MYDMRQTDSQQIEMYKANSETQQMGMHQCLSIGFSVKLL